MVEYQEELNKYCDELLDLTEKYKDTIPCYEMVHRMIANAVSMSLCCAPNELVGVKTIMASVETGINEYEETHS